MNKNLIVFILKKETYIDLEIKVNPNDFIGNKDHPVTEQFLSEQGLIAKQNKVLSQALSLDHEINLDPTLKAKNKHYFHITEHQFEYVQNFLQGMQRTKQNGSSDNYFTRFSIKDLIRQILSFICQYNHEDQYFYSNPYQRFMFAFHDSINQIIKGSFIAPIGWQNLEIKYIFKK